MTKEQLAKKIFDECKKEGEPITMEEAIEMAEMEIKANGNRRYEQAEKPKKKVAKSRKVDEEKKIILNSIRALVEGMQLNAGEKANVEMKTETELHFAFNGNSYTLKLTKHRPSD